MRSKKVADTIKSAKLSQPPQVRTDASTAATRLCHAWPHKRGDTMKTIVPILLLAFAASTAQAAETPSHSPLPASECINTQQINEWHIVDARNAVVRTGPKHYLVTLQGACPQLRHPPGLIFRTSPSNAGTSQHRICGDIGETVHSRNQPPCAIQSVSKIDKARFDQLTVDAKRYEGDKATPAH